MKKKSLPDKPLTERHLLTLIFTDMQCFSELGSYDYEGFEKLLAMNRNFLISEFIKSLLFQFINQTTSMITGLEIVQPRIRS